MHAYAASGQDAPRIVRRGGDVLEIECARCQASNSIDAHHCRACGVPFTMEGVTVRGHWMRSDLGTLSVLLGFLSIPLAMLLVVGIAAVVLGIASFARSGRLQPAALFGMVLGSLSTLAGLLLHGL